MEIRKFKLKDGDMVVSNDGEYIHKNDIELYLMTKEKQENSFIEANKNHTDSFVKESVEKSRELIRFIERTLKEFNI